jgi:magnesium transporter
MAHDSGGLRTNLIGRFFTQHPTEAITELESLTPNQIAQLLKGQPAERAGMVLRYLRPDIAADTVAHLPDETLKQVVAHIDSSRMAHLLARLGDEAAAKRLAVLDAAHAKELRELMSYPPNTAGALMDSGVTALRPDATVRDALTRLRKVRHKAVYQLFVVDSEGRVTGTVPLQELAIADPGAHLDSLAIPGPSRVNAVASEEEVVEILEQRKLTSLAVVDANDLLVGVIRHEALLGAAEREASADIQTMVGVSKDEQALSPISFAVRKRLPWLQINLGTAFLAAFVVGLFEDTIAQFTALAVLLPVAAGQSGNTGAQALAVTMRGLALREIRVRQWLKVVGKELAVGAVNGIAVAVVTAVAVFLWSHSTGLALVIGTAMITSMTIASIAGSSVPILLTVLGQDPAAASSIILTTVTDIVGFLSFLGLATLARNAL